MLTTHLFFPNPIVEVEGGRIRATQVQSTVTLFFACRGYLTSKGAGGKGGGIGTNGRADGLFHPKFAVCYRQVLRTKERENGLEKITFQVEGKCFRKQKCFLRFASRHLEFSSP